LDYSRIHGFPEIEFWKERYLCAGDTIEEGNKEILCQQAFLDEDNPERVLDLFMRTNSTNPR